MSENTGLAKLREMPRRGHTGGHREVQLALCQALHALGARQGSAGLAGSQGPFTAPDPVRQAWPGRAWGGPGAVWGRFGAVRECSGSVPGAVRERSEGGPGALRRRSGSVRGRFWAVRGRWPCLPAGQGGERCSLAPLCGMGRGSRRGAQAGEYGRWALAVGTVLHSVPGLGSAPLPPPPV